MSKAKEDKLLYIKIYEHYKQLIFSGDLKEGAKLPSIRKCADSLQVSRTTAETAYNMLAADGYIISKPQSGYYVTKLWKKRKVLYDKESLEESKTVSKLNPDIALVNDKVFDFSITSVGDVKDSFNLNLWRRYVKSALRQGDRLISYGAPQGEDDLRIALCDYLIKSRNAVCTPEQIVIGAGFQSLLHIICPLIKEYKQVGFIDPKFVRGQAIFEDYGFDIIKGRENTKNIKSDGLLYLTPSHMNRWGEVMSVKDRFNYIQKAEDNNLMIIEDDYDCEFASEGHSVSSIQGLDGGKNVIYLGTFSRTLLPSIRISFMILPNTLLEKYKKRRKLYNQTVSKAEQIAICQYIRDGHLQYQIKKTKKVYEDNINKLYKLTKEIFKEVGDFVNVSRNKMDMLIRINFKSDIYEEIYILLEKKNIILGKIFDDKGKLVSLYMSASGVNIDDWEKQVVIIKDEIKNIYIKSS